MQNTKPHTKHFLCFQQMSDICPGISSAGRAAASFLDGAAIQFILRIKQIDLTLIGIQMTVPAVPCRVNAVEEVHSPLHSFQNVCRRAHSHQICRLILRQVRNRLLNDMVHLLMTLPHRQPAQRITVTLHLGNLLCVADSDIIEYRTLIDTEKKLVLIDRVFQAVQPFHFHLAPFKPSCGARDGSFHIMPVCHTGRAFVKRHCHGRSQVGLDPHTLLRTHENLSSVHVRIKIDSLLFDPAQACQGKNLKPA